MYYGGESTAFDDAHKLVAQCDELMLMRSRTNDKEEFARYVVHNLFGGGAVVDMLSVAADVGETFKRLSGLIGFDSSVFKIVYTNDTIFDEFLRNFAQHAVNSRTSPAAASGSVYVRLLMEYLIHILPVDDAKLHVLKNNNWLAATFRSSTATPQRVSSPRKLLRPEVIAASSPLDYGVRSTSLRGVYPRLVQFLGGLVCQLASLSAWPSLAQCAVLRSILTHYADFMLRETEDGDFVSMKFLLNKHSMFVPPLQQFVQRLLVNWPLNASYIELIELWTTLTHHSALETRDRERRRQFFELSARHFIGYFELIAQRVVDADCPTLLTSGVLDFVKKRVFEQPYYQRLFSDVGMPTADYVAAIRRKLALFRDEQRRLAAGIGASGGDGFGAKLVRFLASLSDSTASSVDAAECHIRWLDQLLDTLRERDANGQCTPCSRQLADGGGPSSSTPIDGDSTVGSPSAAVGATTAAWSPSPITSTAADSSNSSSRSWLHVNSTKAVITTAGGVTDAQPVMPDHEMDPWTKLFYLTPTGRNQVLNRKSHFDFNSCSKQIVATFPHVTRWEIPVLARWMHNLSVRYTNCRLAKWLRFHRNDSLLTKKMAGVLLTAPSPPRYVPVFSRTVPHHPSRLNLRLFANIPFLVAVYLFIYLCYLLIKWTLF